MFYFGLLVLTYLCGGYVDTANHVEVCEMKLWRSRLKDETSADIQTCSTRAITNTGADTVL